MRSVYVKCNSSRRYMLQKGVRMHAEQEHVEGSNEILPIEVTATHETSTWLQRDTNTCHDAHALIASANRESCSTQTRCPQMHTGTTQEWLEHVYDHQQKRSVKKTNAMRLHAAVLFASS